MALSLPFPARAEEPSREALLGLARQFVGSVKSDFKKADRHLRQRESEEARAQRYFDTIPEEETLLLQLRLGKVWVEEPVMGVKRGRDVMLSLTDFAAAADFAIKVDAENKKAGGWFVRETQTFSLDPAGKKVVANGKSFDIAEGDVDIETQPGDILVRSQALAQWLDFAVLTNVMRQSLDIVNAQKWPPQEKVEREERAKNAPKPIPPPHMPRNEEPYELASVPNVDIYTVQHLTHGSGDSLGNSATYAVQASGDLLEHTAKVYVTGTSQDRINGGRVTLSQTSDQPELLGRMKARKYELGDINTVSVPYGAAGAGEIGVRVTNKDPYATFNTATEIRGDGTPGWDVELYREGQYIGLAKPGPDGQYEFIGVPLFSGDNNFRIVHYGPQGEMKEEKRTFSVKPHLYNAEGGAYDISVSAQGTSVWQKHSRTDPDRYSPRLAATYEKQLLPQTAVRTGIQVLQQEEEQKAYLHLGGVQGFGRTVFNADAVVDDDLRYTAAGTARTKLGEHSMRASMQYTAENYAPSGKEPPPGEVQYDTYNYNAGVTGPIPFNIGRRPKYDATASYTMKGDETGTSRESLSLSTATKRNTFSNTLVRTQSWDDISTTRAVDGVLSVGGSALGTGMRLSTIYGLSPVREIKGYELEMNRNLAPKVKSKLKTLYTPASDFWKSTLSIGWAGEHITINPTVVYDSANAWDALIRMHMGLGRNPYTGDIAVSGPALADKAGIAARVFLDRNGDKLFSPGDELIEGATIRAIHGRRQAETDANGEAYIANLPSNTITDVVIEEGSMFDPTWVSGIEGWSVRPRPGHVERLDFPIHLGGEIDGTVYIRMAAGKPRAMRSPNLLLYDGDGKIKKRVQAGMDGYYLFERVPPGRYFLMVDGNDAAGARVVRPPPQEINIGYEGTVVSGQDIYVDPGKGDIPVGVLADLSDYEAQNPSMDKSALQGKSIILNLGDYRSRLLATLVWYRLKTRYAPIIGDAYALAPPSEGLESPKTGLHTLRVLIPGFDMQGAWHRCRALSSRGFYCAVELLPEGMPKQAMADTGMSRL